MAHPKVKVNKTCRLHGTDHPGPSHYDREGTQPTLERLLLSASCTQFLFPFRSRRSRRCVPAPEPPVSRAASSHRPGCGRLYLRLAGRRKAQSLSPYAFVDSRLDKRWTDLRRYVEHKRYPNRETFSVLVLIRTHLRRLAYPPEPAPSVAQVPSPDASCANGEQHARLLDESAELERQRTRADCGSTRCLRIAHA